MPSKELIIPFPLAGLTKGRGYQTSEAQTTRDSKNVVPDDSTESRMRGGTRPGLTKRYETSAMAEPKFLIRVSGGDSSEVYEFILVGIADNVFLGQSVPSGEVIPITYSEELGALTGKLVTDDGDQLITDGGDDLVVDSFNFENVDAENVVQYQEKVILGSNGEVLQGGADGTITASGGATSVLDDVAGTNWVTLGVDPEKHYVEITATADSDVQLRTYTISSVSTSTITLAQNALTSLSGGPHTVTYRIVPTVRDLNPNTPTVDPLLPTGGFVPVGTDAVVSYRDRLVWAISRTWFMSRQGDPGDYDYAAEITDPTRAIAGSASGPGEPADPIIAMVNAGYDYLVLFSEASTWVMRGDPGYGGQLYNISETAGCVGNKAWCHGDQTEIYFLGKDGLYLMAPDAGKITALSPDKLPRDLRGSNRDNQYITLVYDPEDDGVLIFDVPRTGDTGLHFWYDIKTQSFWPLELCRDSHQPIDAITFGGNPSRSRKAVLACIDGYIREWSGVTDDGDLIENYVVFGPFPLSGVINFDGILTELLLITDEASATVTMEIYVGSSPQEATTRAIAGTAPLFTTTVTAGRGMNKYPRARGSAFCIRVAASDAWAFEGMSGMVAVAGKTRRF